MLENGEVAEMKWINKNNQIAGGLTKKEGFKEGLIKYAIDTKVHIRARHERGGDISRN